MCCSLHDEHFISISSDKVYTVSLVCISKSLQLSDLLCFRLWNHNDIHFKSRWKASEHWWRTQPSNKCSISGKNVKGSSINNCDVSGQFIITSLKAALIIYYAESKLLSAGGTSLQERNDQSKWQQSRKCFSFSFWRFRHLQKQEITGNTKRLGRYGREVCVACTLLFCLQAEQWINAFMFKGDGIKHNSKNSISLHWFYMQRVGYKQCKEQQIICIISSFMWWSHSVAQEDQLWLNEWKKCKIYLVILSYWLQVRE